MVMAIQSKTEKFLTPREAAELLGFAEDTVRRYINRKLIKAHKFGNTWAVSESECKRYKAEKRAMGRPKNNFK